MHCTFYLEPTAYIANPAHNHISNAIPINFMQQLCPGLVRLSPLSKPTMPGNEQPRVHRIGFTQLSSDNPVQTRQRKVK